MRSNKTKLIRRIDMIDIRDLTLNQIKEIKEIVEMKTGSVGKHSMLNRRCILRTYSAGVHIGDVVEINGCEARLVNALRLWKWEGGGLSLSAVANNGIKGGRLNRTNEVYLTNVIEFIPTTGKAEATFLNFIEDEETTETDDAE